MEANMASVVVFGITFLVLIGFLLAIRETNRYNRSLVAAVFHDKTSGRSYKTHNK